MLLPNFLPNKVFGYLFIGGHCSVGELNNVDFFLIDLVQLPGVAIWAYLCAKILPMRHARAFLAICALQPISCAALTVFLGVSLDLSLGPTYVLAFVYLFILSVIVPFVLPCVWYEGPWAIGIVLSIMANVALYFKDVIAEGFFL